MGWREALTSAVMCLAGAPLATAATPLPTTQIAPGIYVHAGVPDEASAANEDAIANVGFIVGDTSVLVVDPGGCAREGEGLRAAIREVTDRPIRFVVLTHVHPDHIFGAAAFKDDSPEFVGHAKLPGALAQRGAFYLRNLPAKSAPGTWRGGGWQRDRRTDSPSRDVCGVRSWPAGRYR
jgi:glyoxylase-like metal-dependent hydrolase (beta-lactamase superfamily II)